MNNNLPDHRNRPTKFTYGLPLSQVTGTPSQPTSPRSEKTDVPPIDQELPSPRELSTRSKKGETPKKVPTSPRIKGTRGSRFARSGDNPAESMAEQGKGKVDAVGSVEKKGSGAISPLKTDKKTNDPSRRQTVAFSGNPTELSSPMVSPRQSNVAIGSAAIRQTETRGRPPGSHDEVSSEFRAGEFLPRRDSSPSKNVFGRFKSPGKKSNDLLDPFTKEMLPATPMKSPPMPASDSPAPDSDHPAQSEKSIVTFAQPKGNAGETNVLRREDSVMNLVNKSVAELRNSRDKAVVKAAPDNEPEVQRVDSSEQLDFLKAKVRKSQKIPKAFIRPIQLKQATPQPSPAHSEEPAVPVNAADANLDSQEALLKGIALDLRTTYSTSNVDHEVVAKRLIDKVIAAVAAAMVDAEMRAAQQARKEKKEPANT